MLSETSTKSRMVIAKSFFSSFHGLEVSEWGREATTDFSNKTERAIFAKGKTNLSKSSILLDDADGTPVLGNLFS